MIWLQEPWLTSPDTQTVLQALENAGAQAFLVGGCVRNALLDCPVGDIDISTDATPHRVTQIVTAAGLRAVPTGIDHGTVTVVTENTAFEVTTFRHDVETDGRRAVVSFATTVEEDAARRDFTMNALYARKDGTVVDPLGGLDDINTRKVRFIGTPSDRIREDYLRSLRYFRFHALYGDPENGFDADALGGIAANLDGITQLSRERIGAEMMKLLAAPDPAPSVATMRQIGLLALCLPGADDTALGPLVHLESQAGLPPIALRRLSVIGGEDPMQALRLSKSQNRALGTLRNEIGSTREAAELAYLHGADTARNVALLRAASFETPPPPDLEARITLGADAQLPIQAADLMEQFSGPALGARLKELEQAWIASDFQLDRSALMAL